MTTTTKSSTLDTTMDQSASTADDLGRRARDMATTVTGAAEEFKARLPEAATEVDRLIRSGSDDTLRLVTATLVGFAVGLLVGGANRLLILAALIPAGLISLVLSGRRSV